MTALATPAANPPDEYTWVGLIPPDDQEADTAQWITREQLLAEFGNTARPVTERALKSWEAKGILPRPLVRWKDGRPHTWYPPALAHDAVYRLVNLKERHPLKLVATILKGHIQAMIVYGTPEGETPSERWNAILQDIANQFAPLEDIYQQFTGRRLSQVEIKVTDDADESFTVTYPWSTWRQ